MLICARSALGRQNNKRMKKEVKPQTIEQRMLEFFGGLRGGCYHLDCLCQAFPKNTSQVLSVQIAGCLNKLILTGKVRLSRFKLDHGRAMVYFTVVNQKVIKAKGQERRKKKCRWLS